MKLGRIKQRKPISMYSTKQLDLYQGLHKDSVKIKKELKKRGKED